MWHIIEADENSLFLVLQSWQWPSLEIENLIRMYVIS